MAGEENAAAVALLGLAWTDERVHRLGEVPTNPATPYAVVSTSAGDPQNYREGSVHTSKSRYLTVQLVGRNTDELDFAIERTQETFLDRRILPDATPCRQTPAPGPTRDPDAGGLLYVPLIYRYTR